MPPRSHNTRNGDLGNGMIVGDGSQGRRKKARGRGEAAERGREGEREVDSEVYVGMVEQEEEEDEAEQQDPLYRMPHCEGSTPPWPAEEAVEKLREVRTNG